MALTKVRHKKKKIRRNKKGQKLGFLEPPSSPIFQKFRKFVENRAMRQHRGHTGQI